MPPRVTYWTGTWDPAKEAISKEIDVLRRTGPTLRPVVGFSPGNRTGCDVGQRVALLSERRWLMLRAVAAAVEPRGDISHVFGGFSSWHLLRALGRRPIIMTAVVPREEGQQIPIHGIAFVAVEAERDAADWVNAGIPRDRVHTVLPGLDLQWYGYLPPPVSARFSVLFASTPDNPDDFDARGIPLLVELARLRPDIDIVMPWRQWGDVGAAQRALAALQPPSNLLVLHEAVVDMRALFARTHCTIACFRPGHGKSCPNSIIEGMACGRPAIVTDTSGIAEVLRRTRSGLVTSRVVTDIGVALDVLKQDWFEYSRAARSAAELLFDIDRFLAQYQHLYSMIREMPRAVRPTDPQPSDLMV